METGAFDRSRITTEPGERACAFSPPAGWRGCGTDYLELMRVRYAADMEFQANLDSYVRYYEKYADQVDIAGPFADQAVSILRRLAYRRHQTPTG